MEVLVEAASEVPQGCFVAVRLGENLKQRRFNKSTAKYYFPLPQEKGKARIDVYQLVGTCSVPVDPATNGTEEVNAISGDSSDIVKLRVSTCNRDLKPEDAAKQRREIEAETKDAATGYLQKHGIEEKLADCLRTMLRMKPEDPVEFMCKFLRGGEPEAVQEPAVAPAVAPVVAPVVASAPPVTESVEETKPPAPPAPPAAAVEENRPQAKPAAAAEQAVTVESPASPASPETQPEAPVQQVRSSPAARAALMNSVRQGDLISALEEEDTMNVPFALRPSVGTWLMPLSVEKEPHAEAPPMTYRRGSTEVVPEVAVGNWLCAQNSSFNLKGLGKTPTECCEVERLVTKALMEMDGELQGDYFAMGTTHPLSLGASEKAALESKKLMFQSKDLSGRGVYLTEKEDLALWINAEKHLQILVHSSAKQNLAHKIDMMVSALQGPLLQDGYTLSP